MTKQSQADISKEQTVYANFLERGMLLGLAIMFLTFGLYAFGFISPVIPLDRLPDYWSLSATEYLDAIERDYLHLGHTVTGWTWTTLLLYGDFMNFIGIAILSGITIVCYGIIVPILWSNHDKLYTCLVIAEIVILVLAASGILKSGH